MVFCAEISKKGNDGKSHYSARANPMRLLRRYTPRNDKENEKKGLCEPEGRGNLVFQEIASSLPAYRQAGASSQ